MKITKSQAELYQVRPNDGSFAWGDIVLLCGKESVSVMAMSDFGSFDYRWTHCGGNPKKFLCEIDFQYAMNRLTGSKLYKPDPGQYADEIKQRIIGSRRESSLTKDKARQAWDDMLDILEEYQGGDLFFNALIEHQLFIDVFGDYDALPSGEMTCPYALSFWNEIWLPFISALEHE